MTSDTKLILKIKLCRDHNRIKNENNTYKKQKIKSNFKKNYKNLYTLILTMSNFRISIKNIDNLDLDYLIEVSTKKNVISVDMPIFMIPIIKDSILTTISMSVLTYSNVDTLKLIKINPYYTFYVYNIEKTSGRFCMQGDNLEIKRKMRKDKIIEIEKNEML